MREYTAKEIKLLQANPYTFKVTKCQLHFTIEFKQAFWTAYIAGMAPRKILGDLGYDTSMFGQKQIDSMTQSIKRQAMSPAGFRQGSNRCMRGKNSMLVPITNNTEDKSVLKSVINELSYLRQEVEFLKKIVKTQNTPKRKS